MLPPPLQRFLGGGCPRVHTPPLARTTDFFLNIYLCWPTSVSSFPPRPSHIILITYYASFLYYIYIYINYNYIHCDACAIDADHKLDFFFKHCPCTLIWSSNSSRSSFCFVRIQYLKIITIQLADGWRI